MLIKIHLLYHIYINLRMLKLTLLFELSLKEEILDETDEYVDVHNKYAETL